MMGKTKEDGRQSSLEVVANIVEETGNKRKVSSACKLLQISQRVEEEEVSGDLELVAPVAIVSRRLIQRTLKRKPWTKNQMCVEQVTIRIIPAPLP